MCLFLFFVGAWGTIHHEQRSSLPTVSFNLPISPHEIQRRNYETM
uniref:Uncharacterized protein n=1 Tax=Anguilla anguilla TaxID=7936 RepID=A0A0E9WJR1_ANGAN